MCKREQDEIQSIVLPRLSYANSGLARICSTHPRAMDFHTKRIATVCAEMLN